MSCFRQLQMSRWGIRLGAGERQHRHRLKHFASEMESVCPRLPNMLVPELDSTQQTRNGRQKHRVDAN